MASARSESPPSELDEIVRAPYTRTGPSGADEIGIARSKEREMPTHRLTCNAISLCAAFSAWACSTVAAADIVSRLRLETPEIEGGLTYSVYLPPEHDDGRRFPVVYLLHGLGASAREWTETVGIEDAMDRLVASGTIEPMIIVMPDAG